ncbi:MAG: isoleucine--tRNA ligase [Legionella sp.]|nr:isoleucine--tRNA ligase [Legionella sp.]
MIEYKDTLNLPHTNFPMKASLATREPLMLAQWQSQELYKQIRKSRSGRPSFILHDGPPYANGHLHCGHALNKILKDIVIKSKTLSGFDAPFIPGWDCHGLPIELNVEKKIGKAGVKIHARDFRAKCREYAASQIDIQREEFQRLGVFGDWYNPYITMDYKYEADVVRALGLMIQNGHLQQGFKPIHWCIDCGSALAEAEVDYEDKTSPSIDVAFLAVDAQAFLAHFDKKLQTKPVKLVIWTTTPWTLPANEAVCLNALIEYSLVDTKDTYLLIATELVESVMTRYDNHDYVIHGKQKGQVFEHLKLKHPFYEREVPVVLGEHVAIETGTGCVHTAPAHGVDDYIIGKKYDLPLINPVQSNGCFAEDVELFAGVSVLKANDKIIDVLMDKGMLLAQKRILHSYPHCWRHKTPTIFLATPQWFISMEKNDLRHKIMNQVNTVKWIPEWGKARIHKMIESRPDWCISRQRAWGIPMPLFVHKSTRELHPDTLNLLEQAASLIEASGIDAWFELEPAQLLGEDAAYYDKITDTMDVWLDSGVSHFCVLKQNHSFPADVYFEGSDQHRGWFNSSLTTAAAMFGQAPYKTVLTHGYTVDSEGKKLSKSSGNYVALDKMISQYGADILRLWVSSTDYRNEVSISDEIIKRIADAYRRIRNTARFMLANLFDFDPAQCVADKELLELDRWALARCQSIQKDILLAYEQYNFHHIFQKIHNFCAIDMGSFYLDLIKDRQYTTATDSRARRSCQTALYHITKALTLWLAPILSFTAEEIWQLIPGSNKQSIFLEAWYEDWPTIDCVNIEDWEQYHVVRDEVNKALEETRGTGDIGSGLAAEVTLYADDTLMPKLTRLGEELRFLLITSEAKVLPLNQKPVGLRVTESGLGVEVAASKYEKCARCWHRRPDIGQQDQHPTLCMRCIGNISGDDEVRQFI